jgi:hypothetical protein
LERLIGAGIPLARGEAQGRETIALADGTCDILYGLHPNAVPDYQEGAEINLSPAVVKSLGGSFSVTCEALAQ